MRRYTLVAIVIQVPALVAGIVLVLLVLAACEVPCPYPKPLMCGPIGTPIP